MCCTISAGRGDTCLTEELRRLRARSAALLRVAGHWPRYGAGTHWTSGRAAMAQKISVVLEDDLTGGPADQTIRFAFDGTDYEIDLNAKFSRQLAPYGGHARRAGRAQSHRPGRTAN